MKEEIKMPCPGVFISSGGIKDRKIRERNRGPKKSDTLFSDSVWMCLHRRGFSKTLPCKSNVEEIHNILFSWTV